MFMLDSVLVNLSITHALPMPELQRVSLFDPLIVPAVRAESRYREVLLP